MCRIVAYLGEPISLAALFSDPEHSLMKQSWAPRMQTHGLLNADGFGAGWYDHATRAEPARYRRAIPAWTDQSFASFAPLVHSGAIMASVRSATPGFPVEESATAPFTYDRYLFAHNGAVEGFKEQTGEALRAMVSLPRRTALQSTVDSEVLFALVLDRLFDGYDLATALASVVTTVKEVAGGRLNLFLTDGTTIAATAVGNSSFTRQDPSFVVVASEPYDNDAAWQAVPDLSVITATREQIRRDPI